MALMKNVVISGTGLYQPPHVITNAELVASLPEHQAQTVLIDADWDKISALPSASVDFSQLDDLAYVIYTSGSTGLPKGVQITQRNLANFLNTMQERPGIGPDDTLLAVTTLSFDIATLELYLPLTLLILAGVAAAAVQAVGLARRRGLASFVRRGVETGPKHRS